MEKNLQYTAPLLEQSRMDIIFVFVVLTDALFLIFNWSRQSTTFWF